MTSPHALQCPLPNLVNAVMVSELKEALIVHLLEPLLDILGIQAQAQQEQIVLAQAGTSPVTAALSSAAVQGRQRRNRPHATGAIVAHGERRHDGLLQAHEPALLPSHAGRTVRNLLPAGARRPLANMAEAVLGDVDEAAVALARDLQQAARAVAQARQRPRPVSVEHHVGIAQQRVEGRAPAAAPQVQLRRVLAHVHVHLEERHVAQRW